MVNTVIVPPPTIAGFLAFLSAIVQIPATALPASSPYPALAFDNAVALVNTSINVASPLIYTEAVYNLATSNLLNFCPDQVGVVYKDDLGFFAYIRNKWDLTSFIGGIITSTSDEGTSESMTVPDYFSLFTVADLQSLKDPYGRRYLAVAQKYGPALWGLS